MQMYDSHSIKEETTDKVFQEQRGASLFDFDLFNFQDLLNAQDPTLQWKGIKGLIWTCDLQPLSVKQ